MVLNRADVGAERRAVATSELNERSGWRVLSGGCREARETTVAARAQYTCKPMHARKTDSS
jgi:hypothetical protein